VRPVQQAELDLAVQEAWPPRATVAVGPWTARLDAGVTRRPNSILPHGHGPEPGDDELDALLARTVSLYREHGLVPWIQVTEAAWPPRLEERLAERGWPTGIDPTLLLAGPLVAAAPDGVLLEPRASEAWLSAWWSIDPRGDAAAVGAVARLLTRIEGGAFASVVEGGRTVGVALGVLVGGLLVLECVATDPTARRRGVATRCISALGAWAAERGARQVLLAVQERSVPALALYARLGLERASSYAYARPAG
jgi:GNAT superfamily N-acetyltransferase